MAKIINQKLQEYRIRVDEIVKDLHQMTIDIQNTDLAQTVSDLRSRINEPFMFVIVGEVKSGKSSFINALLESGDKEICAVAPDPCTDTIQQIIYGEEEQTLVLNEHLKKIVQPIEILKEIAIVDTPGTNAIIKHHQEITERFIPSSDLIVFVFEAKNPYRQSAWEFFDFINTDWRKKIIFILQQADLMDADDLTVNINGVVKYAHKKGINDPQVFAVSAKQEQKGLAEESGFKAVRAYIKENITGGKAPLLKLQNNVATAANISDRIKVGLDELHAQLKADKTFRADINKTLDDQESFSNNQVDLLCENILATYDKITLKTEQEINSGLGFFSLVKRTIQSIFVKQQNVKDWIETVFKDLEQQLNQQLHVKLNEGVLDIADSIQRMVKMIDLKIKNSKTILKDDHAIFGELADQRSTVLKDLQAEFSTFMNRSENFVDARVFPKDTSFSPDLAAGSGIAAIGLILMTVTQGVVFDITGGVISALGFLFAGITASMKRKNIVQQYRKEINVGRERLEHEVDEKLKAYIQSVKDNTNKNFIDFDLMLEIEEQKAAKYTQQHKSIANRLEEVDNLVN